MGPQMNTKVLMSGTRYFSVQELNPYSNAARQPNPEVAATEHASVATALQFAGIEVVKVPEPQDCQDGVYTANWGLLKDNTVVLSYLPNMRRAEQPYAEQELRDMGYEVIKAPYRFSGQGDA